MSICKHMLYIKQHLAYAALHAVQKCSLPCKTNETEHVLDSPVQPPTCESCCSIACRYWCCLAAGRGRGTSHRS